MENSINDLFIFEMANNHQGDIAHAKRIIAALGAISERFNINSAVKLQYRNLETFIHPKYKGNRDVKHISRFEDCRLTYEEFCILVNYIRENNMIPMSTPFDEDGVEWCIKQDLPIIKVASCSSKDWPLLERIAESGKHIIISTGGDNIVDIDNIYSFFRHKECDFSMMHCIAEYPAPSSHIQLNMIDIMRRRYPDILIGYSGHENPDDDSVQIMAIAKGARILERHVGIPTKEIKLNSYSLNMEQVERWVSNVIVARETCELDGCSKKKVMPKELESIQSLQRGVYATKDINIGEVINKDNVFFAMPCIDGQLRSGEIGKSLLTATREYKRLEPIFEKRLDTATNLKRRILHEARGLISEAGINVGNEYSVEISHHYGLENFEKYGCVIVNLINREYCKKLIVVFPAQCHPNHMHRIKEETFQVLYGDLECKINGETRLMHAGDIQVIHRNDWHSFKTTGGAIFEEISTTHVVGDSYYQDRMINEEDIMERKTIVQRW